MMYVNLHLSNSVETYAIAAKTVIVIGQTITDVNGIVHSSGRCMDLHEVDDYFAVVYHFVPAYMQCANEEVYDEYCEFLRIHGNDIDSSIRFAFKLAVMYAAGPLYQFVDRDRLDGLHDEYAGFAVSQPKSDTPICDDDLPFLKFSQNVY